MSFNNNIYLLEILSNLYIIGYVYFVYVVVGICIGRCINSDTVNIYIIYIVVDHSENKIIDRIQSETIM